MSDLSLGRDKDKGKIKGDGPEKKEKKGLFKMKW